MAYLVLKWVHIVSATILFGTGIGTAFFMFAANLRRDPAGIAFTARHVVLADWLFTTPAIVIQFASGLLLIDAAGHDLSEIWLQAGIVLFFFVGACWLPVVRIQMRMRDIAAAAVAAETALPDTYWRLARAWTLLGALAFPAMLVIFYLMIVRPA